MTRITTPTVPTFLAALVLMGIAAGSIACSDDDDDGLLDNQNEDTTDEDNGSDDNADNADDTGDSDEDINTSPTSGSEYIATYQQIASSLADQFGDECVGAVDLSGLDFSEIELPDQCRDYFEEFAGQLDEVEPPDACADLHELLVNALNSLADGDDGVVQDLLEGEDGQASEGIVDATIDCSGI